MGDELVEHPGGDRRSRKRVRLLLGAQALELGAYLLNRNGNAESIRRRRLDAPKFAQSLEQRVAARLVESEGELLLIRAFRESLAHP